MNRRSTYSAMVIEGPAATLPVIQSVVIRVGLSSSITGPVECVIGVSEAGCIGSPYTFRITAASTRETPRVVRSTTYQAWQRGFRGCCGILSTKARASGATFRWALAGEELCCRD